MLTCCQVSARRLNKQAACSGCPQRTDCAAQHHQPAASRYDSGAAHPLPVKTQVLPAAAAEGALERRPSSHGNARNQTGVVRAEEGAGGSGALALGSGADASGFGAGAGGSGAGVVGSGTGPSPVRKLQPRGSGGSRRGQAGEGGGRGGVATGKRGVASGRLPRARARRRRGGPALGRRMAPVRKQRDDVLKNADTQVSPV